MAAAAPSAADAAGFAAADVGFDIGALGDLLGLLRLPSTIHPSSSTYTESGSSLCVGRWPWEDPRPLAPSFRSATEAPQSAAKLVAVAQSAGVKLTLPVQSRPRTRRRCYRAPVQAVPPMPTIAENQAWLVSSSDCIVAPVAEREASVEEFADSLSESTEAGLLDAAQYAAVREISPGGLMASCKEAAPLPDAISPSLACRNNGPLDETVANGVDAAAQRMLEPGAVISASPVRAADLLSDDAGGAVAETVASPRDIEAHDLPQAKLSLWCCTLRGYQNKSLRLLSM